MINPEARIKNDEKRQRPEHSEVERLMGNNRRIGKLTGWSPAYSIESGLEETISWFREAGNLKHYKPEIYNV